MITTQDAIDLKDALEEVRELANSLALDEVEALLEEALALVAGLAP